MAEQPQAGFQQAVDSTIDLPLVGVPLQRGTGTTDQRYVNVFFDVLQNPITGGVSAYATKRWGLAAHLQVAELGAGRGTHFWEGSGRIYSVVGNKIYSNDTDLGVTLAASTGRVWFTETAPTSSTRLLVVSDGSDNYNITTSDVITQIDESDDPQYPTNNVGCIVFLNTYLLQAQTNGNVWNTDPDDFDSWNGLAVEDADSYGDELVAIARLRDQVVVFGRYSTEFYFDNGTTPTPLLRIPQNTMNIGMAHANSLANMGDTLCFVAEAPANGEGGRTVWVMEPKQTNRISSPVIERFLDAETDSIADCSAWMERIGGHTFYVLNLSESNRTFVYDLTNQMWCEWQDFDGNKFNIISTTSQNGIVYGLDATNGWLYRFSATTYQDDSNDFTVTIQTDNFDFGTPFNKFQTGLWLIGDNVAASVDVSESDDDYATFGTARPMDMTNTRKFLSEGGSFFQRAYKLEFTANAPFRVKKLVLKLEVGDV